MSKFRGAEPNRSPFKNGYANLSKPVSDNDLKPVFSFEYMQDRSGWSVGCCNEQDRAQLASKLFQLSQLSWMQINQAPRHGLGTEKIDRRGIKAQLPRAVTEDTTLLAFRFNGKKPMVGYKDGRTFHILWLDWNFTLYDHS